MGGGLSGQKSQLPQYTTELPGSVLQKCGAPSLPLFLDPTQQSNGPHPVPLFSASVSNTISGPSIIKQSNKEFLPKCSKYSVAILLSHKV